MDLLDRAQTLGVHVVQICDNLPLDALPTDELNRLAGRADELGIQIEVGTRGITPEHLRRYRDLAQHFNSPICRVVVDTAEYEPSLDEIVNMLRGISPAFEAVGVTLAIENHDRFRVRELVDVLEAVDSPAVGICLDTANSFGALEGPEVVVDALAPWTVNLHLKDFGIQRLSHNLGFIIKGCPMGQGRLDLPWLLERLSAAGRDPNAVLELWTSPEDDIEATVRKEAAWAEESVVFCRDYIPD
jgi:sugar phosphate isomerase/epimerase